MEKPSCCRSWFQECQNLKDCIESDILQAPPCVNYDKGPVAKNTFHLYQLPFWSSGVNLVIQPWKLNESVRNELGCWRRRHERICKLEVEFITGNNKRQSDELSESKPILAMKWFNLGSTVLRPWPCSTLRSRNSLDRGVCLPEACMFTYQGFQWATVKPLSTDRTVCQMSAVYVNVMIFV